MAEFSRSSLPHQVVCFNVKDVGKTHQYMIEQGIEVEDIVVEHEAVLKYFVFKDLYGNKLEALQFAG